MQVRIISLDPEDTMKVLGVQAVQSSPESLLLLDSPAMGTSGTEEGRGVGALFLHIGQLSICSHQLLSMFCHFGQSDMDLQSEFIQFAA